MTDLSQMSDSDLKSLYLQALPDSDLHALHQQAAPSGASDIAPSFAGGIERSVAGTAMILPDMLNQAVAGPQELYRGITGREHDNGPMWQPFYSSEDMLQKLPPELRPHDPQTTAGKIAGFLGGVSGGVAAMGSGKILNDAADPFYNLGKNKIISDLMMSKAENPVQAANAIQNAPEYVKGSIPVAGVASGDVGLMGLQRGAENLPASEQMFKDRAIQQTAAQNDALGKVAGNAADMGKLLKARTDATSPLYEQAKNQQINVDAIKPILDDLNKRIALAGPQNDSGKLLIALKNKIEAGLPNSQPTKTGILDANGNMITRPADPALQQPVIGTYRETRDSLNLKGMQPGALGSEVRSNIQPANVALGKALEAQSPSFAQAQALYKQRSIPIDQLEAGQVIKAQIQGNSPNAAGQLPIVQPKLQQMMENGVVNVDGKEIPISDLSPSQQKGLAGLQSDLNRNTQATGSRVAATPASELNNLATKSPIMALASHIPWIKGGVTSQNQKLQQEIARVMLDNPRAAELLKGAPMLLGNKLPTNQALAQMLIQGGINGAGLHQKGSQ